MGNLAIEPSGHNFADPSLPIVGYDRLLNGGTLALIDLANTNLYPNQNAFFAGVANGVPGKGVNTWVAAGGGTQPTFAGGGVEYSSNNLGNPGFNVGTQGAAGPILPTYDLTVQAPGQEVLVILWYMRKATIASNGQVYMTQSLAGSGGGAGSHQLMIFDGPGGLNFVYAGKGFDTGYIAANNVLTQVAFHVKPNGTSAPDVTFYKNGVKQGLFNPPYQALVAFTTAGGLKFGSAGVPNGYVAALSVRLYRMLIENISVSTRDPARQVAKDYALNVARFS